MHDSSILIALKYIINYITAKSIATYTCSMCALLKRSYVLTCIYIANLYCYIHSYVRTITFNIFLYPMGNQLTLWLFNWQLRM